MSNDDEWGYTLFIQQITANGNAADEQDAQSEDSDIDESPCARRFVRRQQWCSFAQMRWNLWFGFGIVSAITTVAFIAAAIVPGGDDNTMQIVLVRSVCFWAF